MTITEAPTPPSRPFVVAVDVDEVLAQYVKGYCAYRATVHEGRVFEVADFHTYKFEEVHGGTLEQCTKDIYGFHDSAFFRDLEVVPGAREALAELASLPGVELHIVTSRHAEITQATCVWLARHFSGLFGDRIHVGNHWGTSSAARVSKPEMCKRIGAAVLIDDSSVYCLEASQHGLHSILFDWEGRYGWSKDCADSAMCKRALSWAEVVTMVRALIKATEVEQGGAVVESTPAVPSVPFPPPTSSGLWIKKSDRDCSVCTTGCVVS